MLLSLCLLVLVPENLNYASTWKQLTFQEADYLRVPNMVSPVGFASLAVIMIGLAVIWNGYRKNMRWTWFVLFIVVSVFIFPVYILPLILMVKASQSFSFSVWLQAAVHSPGPGRVGLERISIFLVMVTALFLPLNAFFGWKRNAPTGSHTD